MLRRSKCPYFITQELIDAEYIDVEKVSINGIYGVSF